MDIPAIGKTFARTDVQGQEQWYLRVHGVTWKHDPKAGVFESVAGTRHGKRVRLPDRMFSGYDRASLADHFITAKVWELLELESLRLNPTRSKTGKPLRTETVREWEQERLTRLRTRCSDLNNAARSRITPASGEEYDKIKEHCEKTLLVTNPTLWRHRRTLRAECAREPELTVALDRALDVLQDTPRDSDERLQADTAWRQARREYNGAVTSCNELLTKPPVVERCRNRLDPRKRVEAQFTVLRRKMAPGLASRCEILERTRGAGNLLRRVNAPGTWLHIFNRSHPSDVDLERFCDIEGEVCASTFTRGAWLAGHKDWYGILLQGPANAVFDRDVWSDIGPRGLRIAGDQEGGPRVEAWVQPAKTRPTALVVANEKVRGWLQAQADKLKIPVLVVKKR